MGGFLIWVKLSFVILQADISYSAPSVCTFDLYLPEDSQTAPLIVMLHGGGWVSGDKSMYAQEARAFCSRGFACATIGYRLAPLDTYPAAIADCQRAVTFLHQNGKSLGFDPEKIYSMGNSAGGHLASMVGLLDQDIESNTPVHRVNGVVAISPITDIRNPSESHFPIAHSFLEQFMGIYHEEDPDLWASASPITHVEAGAPPFLIFHGTEDDVVPITQSETFYQALKNQGNQAEFHQMEGEGHSYQLEAWEGMMVQIKDFLNTL